MPPGKSPERLSTSAAVKRCSDRMRCAKDAPEQVGFHARPGEAVDSGLDRPVTAAGRLTLWRAYLRRANRYWCSPAQRLAPGLAAPVEAGQDRISGALSGQRIWHGQMDAMVTSGDWTREVGEACWGTWLRRATRKR
jgi:hypothetical protein